MYTHIHYSSGNVNSPLNRRNRQTLTTSIEIWRQEVIDSTSSSAISSQPSSPSKRRFIPTGFWKIIFSPTRKRNASLPRKCPERSPSQDEDSPPPFTTQMYGVVLPKEACATCGNVKKESTSIPGSDERENSLVKFGEKLERLARAQRLLEAINAGECREKKGDHSPL